MLSRRELLNTLLASPLLTLVPKTNNLERVDSGPLGMCMLFKFCREKRWDIVSRFIDGCCATYPDLKYDDIAKVLAINLSKLIINNDQIHFIEVNESWGPGSKYRMIF